MKRVVVKVEHCTACKTCEIACAVEHVPGKSLLAGLTNPQSFKPRLRVEPSGPYSLPVRCQHCEDAPCIMACPTGAMHRDEAGGAVLVDEGRCIGCWMCAMVCPFGAISSMGSPAKALKCDFCQERQSQGREPACVESCPTKALELVEIGELEEERRRRYAAQLNAEAVSPVNPLVELWRAGRYQANA